VRGQLTPVLLKERTDSLKQFWRTSIERAAPDCAGLLLLLGRNQRLAFAAAVEKKQKKLEAAYLSEKDDRRKARHVDQAEKPLNRFFGRLTAPQKAVIERWAEDLVPLQSLWLENRRMWQKSLQSVLEINAPEAEKKKLLEQLFVEPEHLWISAYRDAVNRNESLTIAMLADLLVTLTEKQQQHAHNALEILKKDFTALSKE